MRLLPLAFVALLSSGCAEGEPRRTDRALPPGPPPPVSGARAGEIVELGCYLRQGARGPDHAPCARAGLKRGLPAGLLTGSGELYLLIPDPSLEEPVDLAALAGECCDVEGDQVRRAGVKALLFRRISKAP